MSFWFERLKVWITHGHKEHFTSVNGIKHCFNQSKFVYIHCISSIHHWFILYVYFNFLRK